MQGEPPPSPQHQCRHKPLGPSPAGTSCLPTAPGIHSHAAREFMRKETSRQLPGLRFIPRQGLAFRKRIIREFCNQNSFLNQILVRLPAALLLIMLHQCDAWSDINQDAMVLPCAPCAHPHTETLASTTAFSSICLVQIDL